MARKKKTTWIRAANRTFVCEHGPVMSDRAREIDADAAKAYIDAGIAVEAEPHERRVPQRRERMPAMPKQEYPEAVAGRTTGETPVVESSGDDTSPAGVRVEAAPGSADDSEGDTSPEGDE